MQYRHSQRQPILVVDDEPAIAAVMAELLEEAGHRVVCVGSAGEAVDAARIDPPLLAIVDVQLPDLSGYELLQLIRAEHGEGLPIFFVSGVRVEPYDRAAGLLLGADDYLSKPFAADEFLARVTALLRRAEPDVRPEIHLTVRESEVLSLLAEGLEPVDVAHRLGIGARTVGTHVEHIMDKLGAHSRGQMIAFAYRQGLVSTGPETPASSARPGPISLDARR
ncbi:MAG: response regulator transcription factor [Candidatus Limnocylindria bacterium]